MLTDLRLKLDKFDILTLIRFLAEMKVIEVLIYWSELSTRKRTNIFLKMTNYSCKIVAHSCHSSLNWSKSCTV